MAMPSNQDTIWVAEETEGLGVQDFGTIDEVQLMFPEGELVETVQG